MIVCQKYKQSSRALAEIYKTNFEDELHRVIIHGILHYCGFNDKTKVEASLMRKKEDEALSKRTFV